jgi:hypothetical protein
LKQVIAHLLDWNGERDADGGKQVGQQRIAAKVRRDKNASARLIVNHLCAMRKRFELWNHRFDALDAPGSAQSMAKPHILSDGEQERSCAPSHYTLELTLSFLLAIYALQILKRDLPAPGHDDVRIDAEGSKYGDESLRSDIFKQRHNKARDQILETERPPPRLSFR